MSFNPDRRITSLIKPLFDKGYSAHAASKIKLHTMTYFAIKNPNIKTCIKYWKYWKDEYYEAHRKELLTKIRFLQDGLEFTYNLAYGELILVLHEIEQTLEMQRKENELKQFKKFRQENVTNVLTFVPNVDVKLMHLYSQTIGQMVKVQYAMHQTIMGILEMRFNQRKWNKILQTRKLQTHRLLIKSVHFLAKRNKNAKLDCQETPLKETAISISCKICASHRLTSLHYARPNNEGKTCFRKSEKNKNNITICSK